MRTYCATLYNETNTFSPMLADERDFVPMELARKGSPSFEAAFAPVYALGGIVLGEFNRSALPGGVIARGAYERLRDELIAELSSVLPLDLVVLNLHGAMVATGYPDCEGDLLERVRSIVGPRVTITAALDPHAHLTDAMTRNADVLIAYREYPHTDEAATFAEAVHIGVRAAAGEINPVLSVESCGQVDQYPTIRDPMRAIVKLAREWQSMKSVIAVSIIHGFPWGDVHDMGTKVLVVTDGDATLGSQLAADMSRRIRAARGQTANDVIDFREALSRARLGRAPVVVADVADNPGGGAAGDSTFLLRALIEARDSAAFGPIWDPFVVNLAHKAGAGARLHVRLGGKVSAASGEPLDLEVTVSALVESLTTPGVGGYEVAYGRSAMLQAGDVDIVVTSMREQAMLPALFTSMNVTLADKQIIVVKSAQHFAAEFGPIASEIIYAASPGTMHPAFNRLQYHAADRRLWPLNDAQMRTSDGSTPGSRS